MRAVQTHESQSVLETGRSSQLRNAATGGAETRGTSCRRHVMTGHASLDRDVDTTRTGRSLFRPMRVMLSALVVVAALGAGGCKQGDGAMPAKINDVPNRLGDLQRDLAAVVGGEQQAVQDLTDDLLVFTDEPEGKDATKALATTVCSMLVKRSVNDETQAKIVNLLWTSVAARELSERQVDALKDDMRNTLLAVGVTQPDANLAAGRVGVVQNVVTQRTRHWYERY